MELTEKLERSIAAFLTAQNDGAQPPKSVWPEVMIDADGSPRIFPGESDSSKNGQAILVVVQDSNGEEPQFSGNHFHEVEVLLRTPSTVQTEAEGQPDQDGHAEDSALTNHQAAAAALSEVMEQDPFALAQAFMEAVEPADFTIFGGLLSREPVRQQVDKFWMSGWRFRVLAAGTAF